jgi:hypothetical protein
MDGWIDGWTPVREKMDFLSPGLLKECDRAVNVCSTALSSLI